LTFFEAKLSGARIMTTPSGGGKEVLDSEDILLKDFSKEAFIEGLRVVIGHPKLAVEERISRIKVNEWMDSSKSSPMHYEKISKLLNEFNSN
jgi:hypothetical protein